MTAALAALAVFGWSLVLTQGAGPFDVLARLRKVWTRGPLSCPMCVGTWAGLAAGLACLAAERWPALAPIAYVLGAPGAGAGVAWLGVHLSNLLRRETERATQDAWLARLLAQGERERQAHRRATEAHTCALCDETIGAGRDRDHAVICRPALRKRRDPHAVADLADVD